MSNNPVRLIEIQNRKIGDNHPVYFIADIAANHDGSLTRAKDLIRRAADAGAHAAKFQHFKAETIVSDIGFRSLTGLNSHQSKWKKSVYEVYSDASIQLDWTEVLKETCDEAGIAFFTSPYDYDLADYVDPFVPAYKIGSGDITWTGMIKHIASKDKPYILATGAATLADVRRAVDAGLAINPNLALLQCNTNYTGSTENFKYINLNVLKSYRTLYPDIVLGLSDHTAGYVAVLGAVALGAKIIEKHFTDDTERDGPDHSFSMDPRHWQEMMDRCVALEAALGDGLKKIEQNEEETAILQRRSICARRDLAQGKILTYDDLCVLRPAPVGSMPPFMLDQIVGKVLVHAKYRGQHLTSQDVP